MKGVKCKFLLASLLVFIAGSFLQEKPAQALEGSTGYWRATEISVGGKSLTFDYNNFSQTATMRDWAFRVKKFNNQPTLKKGTHVTVSTIIKSEGTQGIVFTPAGEMINYITNVEESFAITKENTITEWQQSDARDYTCLQEKGTYLENESNVKWNYQCDKTDIVYWKTNNGKMQTQQKDTVYAISISFDVTKDWTIAETDDGFQFRVFMDSDTYTVYGLSLTATQTENKTSELQGTINSQTNTLKSATESQTSTLKSATESQTNSINSTSNTNTSKITSSTDKISANQEEEKKKTEQQETEISDNKTEAETETNKTGEEISESTKSTTTTVASAIGAIQNAAVIGSCELPEISAYGFSLGKLNLCAVEPPSWIKGALQIILTFTMILCAFKVVRRLVETVSKTLRGI